MDKTGKMPLLKALLKHQKMIRVPFHMPGHKQGKGVDGAFARMMKSDPFCLDMTEVPGLDDLHNPYGPILQAQNNAARLFGAERTFFLVNGTTVGIHAAIMSACGRNETILLQRDIHRSVIGACILSGVRPEYLPARVAAEFLVPLPPRPHEVKKALDKNRKIKAILQVYPSYYGIAGNVKEIADFAHLHRIPLIADEAHGAHFSFNEGLPFSALKQGADISVQSTHKTLGALTQASMLHVNSSIINADEVLRHLKVLQSTSPSYLLMASLDAVVAQMERHGKSLMEKTISLAEHVRHKIKLIPGLRCLDDAVLGSEQGLAVDPTKIYISVRGIGLTGYKAAEILRKKHGIQVELSDRFSVLCMMTLGNTFDDAESLTKALEQMASVRRPPIRPDDHYDFGLAPLVILTPGEAWFSPKIKIPLRQAVGRIAAEIIAPYPPGIPLLCPGEEITAEIIEAISFLKAQACSFHGPEDPALESINVVRG